MLNHFNEVSDNWLFFEVGDTGADWGQTIGYNFNTTLHNFPNAYRITISNDIDQTGSNLVRLVTLVHELIHAYMFDTLSDAGLISYDSAGEPVLTDTDINNLNCDNLPVITSIELNSYSTSERFSIMMCALIENGLDTTTDWSHDLFGNNVFSVETYQEQLADFLLQNHDWDSEPTSFTLLMASEFGVSWKSDVSEYLSWRGLSNTQAFENWKTQESVNDTDYIAIIGAIRNLANKNCE